jgi:hypothetical protein
MVNPAVKWPNNGQRKPAPETKIPIRPSYTDPKHPIH